MSMDYIQQPLHFFKISILKAGKLIIGDGLKKEGDIN